MAVEDQFQMWMQCNTATQWWATYLNQHEYQVLIEEIEHQQRQSFRVEMPMHEEDFFDHGKIGERIVGTSGCLSTLLAHDAEANVRLLYH